MLVILADDLTGALDTAAPFAGRGLQTRVALGAEAIGEALSHQPDVLSVNLGSRELDENRARALCAAALSALPAGVTLFKKVDSRLKGHIEAELDAVPFRSALVAPAIPAFGRVVQDGCVRGFGVDVPIKIAAKLGRHAAKVRIPDGNTAADMQDVLAQAQAEGVDLLIGARGLAEALALQMSGREEASFTELPTGRALFVVGSRDPITLAQIERLRESTDLDYRAAPNGTLADPVPRGSRLTLVQATPGEGQLSPLEVSDNLARDLCPSFTDAARTLLLCGGATAEAVLARLGVTGFRLMGECLPGLGLAYAGGQCIIAKSGGFGAPDTLRTIAGHTLGDMD